MKLPVYFELDGKFAAILPSSEGGVRVVKDPGLSIADFMQSGLTIAKTDLPESFLADIDSIEPKIDRKKQQEKGKPKNIIEKATRIAEKAHRGQVRKGDDQPYIIHPFMVALKLAKYGFPDAVIAAGLTHDVLEDTDFLEDKLRKELGDEVAEIVKSVTNDDTLVWEEKKKKYIETVRKGPDGAKAVCLADKIHNIESLMIAHEEQGPEIWKRFNRGKEKKNWFESEVLKMLKATWQHPMIDEYEILIEQEKDLK